MLDKYLEAEVGGRREITSSMVERADWNRKFDALCASMRDDPISDYEYVEGGLGCPVGKLGGLWVGALDSHPYRCPTCGR